MEKISLYIAGKKVDLDNNSFILFNYTMEDLSNPTIVKNSFSKSITLKGTPNNNKIFGDIFRLDRKTIFGDSYVGTHFDASRKTPFTIYDELGNIVEEGYVKLDKITRSGVDVEYSITLYGGLGSFFYNIMYNEDGSKKSLLSLRYKTIHGNYTYKPGDLFERGGWDMTQDAWTYLSDPQSYEENPQDNWWCNIINFAPCYNGLPENFSSDKAVYSNLFDNAPNYAYFLREGTTNTRDMYANKKGASSLLMLMGNTHIEWEMLDLRWYLQRPVIRVKAIFDAMCDKVNNGGYDVELQGRFFSIDNPLFWDGWITLPMIAVEDRHADNAILNLLSRSLSPAEYIISYAKVFGLVFLYDVGLKKVTIMTRADFYREGKMIDLTDRVNLESLTISPIIAQSRLYQFGSEAIGEWASDYKLDYGQDYGSHKVNTGNEFNADTTIVTEGIVFKDAVEVQERSLLFYSNDLSRNEGGGMDEYFSLPKYESVKLQMWREVSSGVEEMREYEVKNPYNWLRFPFNSEYPNSDFLPKVQLHDAENKVADGANVLLVFDGTKETPEWNVQGSMAALEYRLTDDTPDMDLLNDGTPCWNYSQINRVYLSKLPSFRRCKTDDDGIILSSYEWGVSAARGVNGVSYGETPHTIYNDWWRRYQRDRYDVDTFKMTCKVNLQGLSVAQKLMRNFFFYQGSLFVLNAIKNHSITTDDLTDCEFIKVKDMDNYTNY